MQFNSTCRRFSSPSSDRLLPLAKTCGPPWDPTCGPPSAANDPRSCFSPSPNHLTAPAPSPCRTLPASPRTLTASPQAPSSCCPLPPLPFRESGDKTLDESGWALSMESRIFVGRFAKAPRLPAPCALRCQQASVGIILRTFLGDTRLSYELFCGVWGAPGLALSSAGSWKT